MHTQALTQTWFEAASLPCSCLCSLPAGSFSFPPPGCPGLAAVYVPASVCRLPSAPPAPRLRQGPLGHFCLSDVSILPGSLKGPAEVWGTSGWTVRVGLPVDTPSHHPWRPGPRVPQTSPAEFWVEALPPAALDGMEAAGQVTSQTSAIS